MPIIRINSDQWSSKRCKAAVNWQAIILKFLQFFVSDLWLHYSSHFVENSAQSSKIKMCVINTKDLEGNFFMPVHVARCLNKMKQTRNDQKQNFNLFILFFTSKKIKKKCWNHMIIIIFWHKLATLCVSFVPLLYSTIIRKIRPLLWMLANFILFSHIHVNSMQSISMNFEAPNADLQIYSCWGVIRG